MQDLARIGGLPSPVESVAIWREIWFEEAHNSTAIEGNTLALKQVKVLLEEGRSVGNKELREYLEVKAYSSAAESVYAQARSPDHRADDGLVTLTEVRRIPRLTVSPRSRCSGRLRVDARPPRTVRAGSGTPILIGQLNDTADGTTYLTNQVNDNTVFVATSDNAGTALTGSSLRGVGVTGLGTRGGAFLGSKAAINLSRTPGDGHPHKGLAGDIVLDRSARLWLCKGGAHWKQLG